MCRSIDPRLLETIGLSEMHNDLENEHDVGPDANDYAHARLIAREIALEERHRATRELDRKSSQRAVRHECRSDERASRKPYIKGGWRRQSDRRYNEPHELADRLSLTRAAYSRLDD